MKPIDPRVPAHLLPPGSRPFVIAEHQEEYIPLPSIRTPDGQVVTRWELTDAERAAIVRGEDLFLTVLTHGALQPVRLSVGLDKWINADAHQEER